MDEEAHMGMEEVAQMYDRWQGNAKRKLKRGYGSSTKNLE